jgi:hypothetical protein
MGKRKLLFGLLALPLLFGMAISDDDMLEETTTEVVEKVCETQTVVKVK